MPLRYRTNASKALEVVLWLASHRDGIDFHRILKLLFLADKYHLNHYGRPVVGDTYYALQYGPVAQTTYDILKGDPLAMELLEISQDERPFRVSDQYHVHANRPADEESLSESDVEALQQAFDRYGHLSFDELTKLTHRDPAWQKGEGGAMDYEDFLDEDNLDPERLEDLKDTASRLVI